MLPLPVKASEFNSYFVKSTGKVDLSSFERSDFIPDGRYKLDLYLNGEYLDTNDFSVEMGNVCFDNDIIDTLPLNEVGVIHYNSTLSKEISECFILSFIEFTTVNFDLAKARLDVSIPQSYLAEDYKNGFVHPKLWDHGVSGAFLDYNINTFSVKQSTDLDWNNSFSLYGLAGVNIGPVRFRSQYQLSNKSSGEFSSYYGYIPIIPIKSKLTFGNTQFSSSVYDSFRMLGVSLQSDDKMLPSYLRGYSPEVSGSVESNAVITISQQGRILKVVNVSAGPYLIDDLPQSTQGDIDVEVKQANGKVEYYQLNGADVQYLTREGDFKYIWSLGAPDQSAYQYTPAFLSAEGAYGVNNYYSLFVGSLISEKYQAYTLGSGVNLGSLGALSFDVSLANANLKDENASGLSYGFSYNNSLTDWGLGIRVAGYRFSQRKFYEFEEYLHTYDEGNESNLYSSNNNKKYEQYITLTQRFFDANLFLSYSTRNYWDERRFSDRFDFTISKPLSINGFNVYLNANIYHSENSYAEYSYQNGLNTYNPNNSESGWSVGMSIPFGNNETLSIQTKVINEKYAQNISYSGKDSENNADYRVSFDQYEGKSVGVSTNYNRDFSYVSTSVGGSYQTDDYIQLNANASGTVLVSREGLAYSNLNAGDTRLLVDTQVSDVAIKGTGNQLSNHYGLALVNGITPYQKSWNFIDYKALSDDIDVQDSIKPVVLTEGAIGLQAIRAKKGSNFLAKLVGDNEVPFGSVVYESSTGDEVGIVGSSQKVYLSGISADSHLIVKWDGGNSCVIDFSHLTLNNNGSIQVFNCF